VNGSFANNSAHGCDHAPRNMAGGPALKTPLEGCCRRPEAKKKYEKWGDKEAMQVLIVDNCPLAVAADHQLLMSVDPSIDVTAVTRREDVAALTRRPADIELALCIMRGTKFPDYSLIEEISHWALGIPVAVLSTEDSIEEMLKVKRCGAAGFVPFSLRREVIVNILRILLTGATYFPICRYLRDTSDSLGAERFGVLRQEHFSPALPILTPRQCEILEALSQGLTNKEIARTMGLSDGTIRAHVAAIYRAMGVRNRSQATKMYFEISRMAGGGAGSGN